MEFNLIFKIIFSRYCAMGLLGFRSRRLKIPKDYRFKNSIINEEEDCVLLLFERKNRKK